MNNLEIFRSTMKEYLPSQQIDSIREFKQTVNHLCNMKLLHPEEVNKLISKFEDKDQIKFPITFNQFQTIIMTQFGDQSSVQLLANLKQIKTRLREVKGVLAIWRDKGLTKKERLQLQSIFQKGNIKLLQLFENLNKQKQQLEQISQQQIQMIESLDEWLIMQKIKQQFVNYEDYQKHHQKLIDQLYNKIRVREVHFKSKKQISKVTEIQTIIGMDSKNDDPVEVILISKKCLAFDKINQKLLTFNAQKQLMLSEHFPNFLGYNTHSDPLCFQYFIEYLEAKKLEEIIYKSKIQLQEQTPIFKYWAYQLYKSFSDLYLMCSYRVALPIRISQIDVAQQGLKLVLKNVQFISKREEEVEQGYQSQLLYNLAIILLQLVRIDIKNWATQNKFKKIQNKSLINCLLNSSQGHLNFKEGKVQSKITFFNLQTHPLFESKSLIDGEVIISNYEQLVK